MASAPNTVSFGTPGAERRLTNVANGIDGTDAVNVSQLNSVRYDMRRAINTVQGGVAMALGAATVNLPLEAGEMGFVGSVGYYRAKRASTSSTRRGRASTS